MRYMAVLHGSNLDDSLVLLHWGTQLLKMVLPGMLLLQQVHMVLQLLERPLQLEALPNQLVQHLQVRSWSFRLWLDCLS